VGLLALLTGLPFVATSLFSLARPNDDLSWAMIGVVPLWLAGIGSLISVYAMTAYKKTENHRANITFLSCLGSILIIQSCLIMISTIAQIQKSWIHRNFLDFWFLWLDIAAVFFWFVSVITYIRYRKSLATSTSNNNIAPTLMEVKQATSQNPQ
jgi:Ca2+/Na+ antiporter